MFLKLAFPATLLLAAAPIAAQPPAAPNPPAAEPAQPAMTAQQAEIQRTAMAFGQCIKTGLDGLSATVTPEAGAASVLAGCAAQRADLGKAVDGMIATLPEDQRAAAHTQFETQIGQAQTQIADAIRQHRAAPPAPPAPPAPH
ncbi:MAG TPA: hypothetical protein VFW19_09540 [Allosphingosinicella sp.]|nr:hypothetical protein [Allosphingosinicella sp.]